MTSFPQTTDSALRRLENNLKEAIDSGSVQKVRNFFQDSEVKALSGQKLVYLYGSMPYTKMLPYCRQDICKWWPLLTAQAALGDMTALKNVYDSHASSDSTEKISFNSTSTWAAYAYTLAKGVDVEPHAEVLSQLFKWGATPDYENGKYFRFAMEKGTHSDVLLAYLKAGLSLDLVHGVISEEKESVVMPENLRRALDDFLSAQMTSSQVLLQEEIRFEKSGLGKLRREFDFRARRVREIYVLPHEKNSAMASISFDDYDVNDIRQARKMLMDLGGNPGDDGAFSDKPRRGLNDLMRRKGG